MSNFDLEIPVTRRKNVYHHKMSNRQFLGRWQIIMIWSERPELEPPCNLHSSLMFSRGHENFICDVIADQDRYIFRWSLGHYSSDPYKTLSVYPLCLLQVDIDALALIRVLAEVHRPTLADDPEYSCQKWVNEALFKLNLRSWISHCDWRYARDCQSSVETASVVGCHVGGRVET
ncbi:hypothetical protein HC256_001737 [Beauveria bassiana]|nr:hypothetical protein HC256_001737 [Beauveria bassiana]